MGNFIATIILIGITLFVLNLFPFFRDWTSGIRNEVNEKTGNVVQEYERVKGEVEEISGKVKDTKEKVEDTLDTVGKAVDTAGNIIDKVDGALKGDDEDEEASDEEEVQEAWRTSDPELDPSIDAGRTNYNYADPGSDGMSEAHLMADIKPWIEWGNSPDDESTKEERISALAITAQGRAMLDALGYEYDTPED